MPSGEAMGGVKINHAFVVEGGAGIDDSGDSDDSVVKANR